MKLTIASMFIASSSLCAPSVSTSGVAASILEHENKKGSFRTAAAKKQGVECTLANTANVQKSAADVGVLSSCRVGEVCVEDSTSKIGGRCKLFVSVSDGAAALEPRRELDGAAALEPRRELEDCEKCSGWEACYGVADKSKIGCGSCIGTWSCFKSASNVIGAGSCTNIAACSNLASNVTIGAGSCTENRACTSGKVNVGASSCNGYKACYLIHGDDVPADKCNGDGLCMYTYKAPPVTPPPSAAPVTSSPVTFSPTANPVTPSPSAAPVTSSPTAAPVTPSPSAAPVTSSPTTAPLTSAPTAVNLCPLMVSKVKVQSLTGLPIEMREVRVFSSEANVAIGKNATQSSDLNDSGIASKAVDGKWGSWSSTGTDTCSTWWELDLGEPFPVEKVIIVNRKCDDDVSCSCKLSHAAMMLFDDQGNVVQAKNLQDTCDKGWVVRNFPASEANCV